MRVMIVCLESPWQPTALSHLLLIALGISEGNDCLSGITIAAHSSFSPVVDCSRNQ